MKFYSQLGQDRYLFENFFAPMNQGTGTFVEIGAYDGETYSNSLFFEESLGWRGLCIEPLPQAFEKLRRRRKNATCLPCGVADYDGTAEFLDVDVVGDERMLSGIVQNYDPRHVARIERAVKHRQVIQVPVRRLSTILEEHGLSSIDYCSIDTEGSEAKILRSLDFGRFPIRFLSIENNYDDPGLREFMARSGYELIHRFEGYDELYRRRADPSRPRTTVLCAVWHGDPDRAALLAGHQRNLEQLRTPTERVYVFDGGQAPPADLRGRAVMTTESLTLYEAWHLGLSLVRTPYVMNLNLDDRLAPDALAVLEAALDHGADLVGGDWRVCHSQAETDQVPPCSAAHEWPFEAQWPPRPGQRTRLGSGTGERGTLGPACLWRTALHGELHGYPHRFGDGEPIRAVGDVLFWTTLQQRHQRLQRVPLLIGNYRSAPERQLEFRARPINEPAHLHRVGVSLVPGAAT